MLVGEVYDVLLPRPSFEDLDLRAGDEVIVSVREPAQPFIRQLEKAKPGLKIRHQGVNAQNTPENSDRRYDQVTYDWGHAVPAVKLQSSS